MTTLSDLTLAQLTTAYGAIVGKTIGTKYFNSKATGIRRLGDLLAERNLTIADALHAAGVATAEPTEAPASSPEPAPITAESPIIDAPAATQGETFVTDTPAHEADRAPTEAKEPTGTTTPPALSEPSDSTPVAPTEASGTAPADPTMVPLILADPTNRNLALEAVLDALIAAGQEPAAALTATEWLETLMTKAQTPPGQRPRQLRNTEPKAPRSGTKQEIVIELLRRPEGATLEQMIEATGWQPHSCRGFLAGAVKKRLGLNLTTERVRMVGGNRQGSPGSYTIYKIA